MHRFWPGLIQPICEIVKPASIIEIGSGEGNNTAHLAEYCLETGSCLHVIDPRPKYDINEWKSRYGDAVTFHQELSLDVLPRIGTCEAAFIDGDHNWHTVFNELLLIEKIADKQKHFPAVFLHDVGWPHGRRDSYHDPQTVPIAHRKPCRKKGVAPDRSDLLDEGGLNDHLYNSIYESTPKNGVLTAVEDFLQTTTHKIRLILIPGLHGLAILLPQSLLDENNALAALADSLELTPFIREHLNAVEKDRVDGMLVQKQLLELTRRKDNDLREREVLISQKDEHIDNLGKFIDHMQSSFGWRFLSRLKNNRILIFLYFFVKQSAALEYASSLLKKLSRQSNSPPQSLPPQSESAPKKKSESVRLNPRVRRGRAVKTNISADVILYSDGDQTGLRNTLISLKSCADCSRHRLYLIDDSGDPSVGKEIGALTSGIANLALIKNERPLGYLRSVSDLAHTLKGRYVCVVRTNVIFTPGWLENLLECSERVPAAGFVSPITTSSMWYECRLNPGDTIYSAAEKIEKLSENIYPAVPLPDPHIFLMKRKMLKKVPLRAASANELAGLYRFFLEACGRRYLPVVADDSLVHVSSEHSEFNRKNQQAALDELAEPLKEELERRRACEIEVLKKYKDSDMRIVNQRRLAIILPPSDENGQAAALAQLANELILRGIEVKCIAPTASAHTSEGSDPLFEAIPESMTDDESKLAQHLPDHCVLLATARFPSLADRLKRIRPDIKVICSDRETADSLHEAVELYFQEKEARTQRKAEDRTCNIIIPIHNELDSVKRCLESIQKHTDHPYRVYLVDDRSDTRTKKYLRDFARNNPEFHLIENETNLGFGASCNRGVAAAGSGDLLLLNSDVIVTPGWLRKIVECAYSDETIGIVTPLSTRSPHCWIKMNPGDNIFTAAAQIEKLSEKRYPDIVTAEGWCFFIKRTCYEHIGLFDPIFGKGYCEDSDLSMRALCHGYRTVCAADTFIFHKGSASFKNERNDRYMHNRRVFDQRWGHYYVKHYEKFRLADPIEYIRSKYKAVAHPKFMTIAEALKRPQNEVLSIMNDRKLHASVDNYLKNIFSWTRANGKPDQSEGVVFLLPVLVKGGGVLSVTQLVNDLILAGVDAKLVVVAPAAHFEDILLLTTPIVYENLETLIRYFPKADYAVATLWVTMYYLVRIIEKHKRMIPCYFIQDFEPYFYEDHELQMRTLTADTYKLPAKRFAKTHWIINKVAELGLRVHKVPPGLDLEIFYPRDRQEAYGERGKFKIAVMMRPSSKRRGFPFLCETLKQVYEEHKENIEIHAFGADDSELSNYSIPFAFVNHGVISPWELAELYSNVDLYIDFSDFHGFGRTAVEAMACGTCVVITDSGGIAEYAVHEHNCLLSEPGNLNSMLSNIRRVMRDSDLRKTLAANGLETVKRFERTFSSLETWKYISNGSLAQRHSDPVPEEKAAPSLPRARKKKVVLIKAGRSNGRLPHALLSLAANLDEDVVLLDSATPGMALEREREIREAICVGLSVGVGPQITCSLEAAKAVRALNPAVPLIWGGRHPSLKPEQTLQNALVDKVVVGQGERVFRDIVKNIKEGNEVADITIAPHEDMGLISLDNLQLIEDMGKYVTSEVGSRTISLYTSRGCPYACAFCANAQYAGKRNGWPVQSIVEFIKRSMKKYAIDGIRFDDDNFFAERKRPIEFSERLLEDNVRIAWSAGACVDSLCALTPEEWEILAKSGCKRLSMCAESGASATRRLLHKTTAPEAIREVAHLCGRYGITPSFSMMVGIPGETYPEMEETFSLLSALKNESPSSELRLLLYIPYPGALLYDLACESGFREPESLEDWGKRYRDIPAIPWMNEALIEYIKEFNAALQATRRFKRTPSEQRRSI